MTSTGATAGRVSTARTRTQSSSGNPASSATAANQWPVDAVYSEEMVATGELLFMQPHDWPLTSEQRANAPANRIANAGQASTKGYVPLRS